MFIIIPLILVFSGLVGIAFMTWRKWTYLKKLEPDAHPVGDSFVHDLAPEAVAQVRRIDVRGLWHHALVGVEKLVAGVREAFRVIDQGTARMVKSLQSANKDAQIASETEAPKPEPMPQYPVMRPDPEGETALLKKQEQQLIVDIAQDPKNVNLYKALAKVYSKLGHVGDAVEALKAAQKLDSTDQEVASRLERAQEKLERKALEQEEARQGNSAED